MFKETESQLEGIRQIFAEAKQQDNWNTDEQMLYSYYFVDEDADKLEELGIKLEENGYDFIGVFELGDEETDEATGEYLLHIDREEKHTPESLAERNVELQKIADEHEIETYDGWEFGEVGVYDDDDEDDDEEEKS
ncbi:MAG: ribonuclease E inhibitor RraB [Acidobacteriota bacterium]|nr:ribonuclease E inhibitor RraB [Acidobacteriota bacterium]